MERALLAVLSTLLGLPITVLYICHRLQHVDHFDLVLVLDEGSGTSHSPANFSTRAWECSAACVFRSARARAAGGDAGAADLAAGGDGDGAAGALTAHQGRGCAVNVTRSFTRVALG